MTVRHAPAQPTHELPGARFTTLISPRCGSTETSVWLLELLRRRRRCAAPRDPRGDLRRARGRRDRDPGRRRPPRARGRHARAGAGRRVHARRRRPLALPGARLPAGRRSRRGRRRPLVHATLGREPPASGPARPRRAPVRSADGSRQHRLPRVRLRRDRPRRVPTPACSGWGRWSAARPSAPASTSYRRARRSARTTTSTATRSGCSCCEGTPTLRVPEGERGSSPGTSSASPPGPRARTRSRTPPTRPCGS